VPDTRQVALPLVAGFARDACEALARAGIAPAERAGVLEAHVTAVCAGCGTTVSGRTLAALAEKQPEGASATDPLRRLDLGYCVMRSCESHFYELTLQPHPAIDWTRVCEPQSAKPQAAPVSDGWLVLVTRSVALALAASQQWVQAQFNWRVAFALAVLLALLLARHWQSGGAIPFIREPRIFTGPAPAAEPAEPGADDEKP